MPARSAWRWPVWQWQSSAAASTGASASCCHCCCSRYPTLLLSTMPEHPGLHRPADPTGSVHGDGFYADARLSRRDIAPSEAARPLPPTSPAMSRAICSAGCCPLPSRTTSAWHGISRCSPHSTCAVRCWCSSALRRTAAKPRGRPGDDERVQRLARQCAQPVAAGGFVLGFCILFAFIGTFTYVNFVLVRQPFDAGADGLGFVYFVFLPSDRDHAAGRPGRTRFGARLTVAAALLFAALGLPLLLSPTLSAVLLGLVAGQRRHVLRAGRRHRLRRPRRHGRPRRASGMYLASYFFGGLVGSAVLGQVFDLLGWAACVAGIGLALVVGIAMTRRLVVTEAKS